MPLPPTTPALSALDVFVTVIDLGSLSKAAQAHNISQPSVSSRVRSLERQLGIKLLNRSPTGSTPTTAGSLVADWATAVLRSADELNAGVTALKARRSGRLRVAASMTNAEYLLPAWLEKFLRNRPRDAIQLQVANSETVLEALLAKKCDLGFIESPQSIPAMSEQVVATDELLAVVGRNHPWAKLDSLPIAVLAGTPLAMREAGSGTRDALEARLQELGLGSPPSAIELGSTSAIRATVAAGGPPAVISELSVRADVAAGSLVIVDIENLSISRKLRAVWAKDDQLHPLADALLNQIGSPE